MREFSLLVDHIRKEKDSIFNFGMEVILPYLPYKYAKEFLKPDCTEQEWQEVSSVEYTRENIIDSMKDYMEFSWEKAENHRGISAVRSIQKMRAWLYMLEDEELFNFANSDENYPRYGCPILAKISKKYNFPIPESHEVKLMIEGKPCSPGCEGCMS